MKIALISCASKKADKKSRAKDLYNSPLFKLNLSYAAKIADKTFILSAKYGLLELEQEIEPYNLTLNNMKDEDIKEWASRVLEQLKQKANLESDEFIFLAGEKYRRHLVSNLKNYKVPMQGLGIGKQLKFLKDNLK